MKKQSSTVVIILLLCIQTIYSQEEFEHSSFPVLKITRTCTATGGSFDTFDGINSGVLLNTKTSNNMLDGFGGGFIFGINDNTISGNNYIGRIYARRDGSDNFGLLQFCTGFSGTEVRMTIRANGYIGIGTTSPYYPLDVEGTIRAHEIKVNLEAGADFVFEEDYNLMPLNELETFVKTQKHLPEVAPAKEMQAEGLSISEMNIKLLQKIEELTLYVIDMDKELQSVKNENKILQERINDLETKKQ